MRCPSGPMGIIAVVLAVTAAAPAAASNYLKCDRCSAPQMRHLALQQGFGRYLVGSVSDHALRAFLVTPASATDNKLQARDGEIYPPERKAFSQLIEFYNLPPVGYDKHVTVQYPGAGDATAVTTGKARPLGPTMSFADPETSAYDVIDGGPRQNAFLQSIKNSGAFKAYGKPPFVEVFPRALTVTFADGGRIGVYIDTGELPYQLLVSGGVCP